MKKHKPPMWERTEYDIISEIETDKELIGVIRNRYNGTNITCHIPKHTKEEEEKLSSALTFYLTQIVFTEQDITGIKDMEITKD